MTNPVHVLNDSTPLGIGNNAKKTFTILQSGSILEGTVMGIITASQKLKPTDSVSVDGSEIPRFILLADVDTTAGDVDREVGVRGDFNEDKLVFVNGGNDIDTVVATLSFYVHLKANGILAVPVTQLDQFDNQ
jgi:hypothetical protein